jgi:glycerol-3-phosphate dehydrogenase
VAALPGAQNWLMDGLSEAMVRFAARFEYARTVEDMLARRSRLLFDARKAAEIASRRRHLTEELGQDVHLNDFLALTRQYLPAQG